jgi:hypothetical protein
LGGEKKRKAAATSSRLRWKKCKNIDPKCKKGGANCWPIIQKLSPLPVLHLRRWGIDRAWHFFLDPNFFVDKGTKHSWRKIHFKIYVKSIFGGLRKKLNKKKINIRTLI